MALRVARGLLRLWLVLSVLWIAGVGIHAWWAIPLYENPISWGAIPVEPLSDAPPLPDAPWIIEQRAAIRFAILLALVPPAFVLALGWALAWALKGFR